MKKFSPLILAWLMTFSVSAIDLITATITVTNTAGTTNGQTLTVNSDTRTWTNSVQVPGSQILTNSTIGGSATNMFNQVANYPFSGLSLAHSGANGILLQTAPGGPLSVSLSAGWGTVVLTTNALTSATVVRVPPDVETAQQKTNVSSGTTAWLRRIENTNVLYESDAVMANFAGLTNNGQTITGSKTFANGFNSFNGAHKTYAPLWLFNSASNTIPAIEATADGPVTNHLFSTPAGWAFGSPVVLGGNLTVGVWALNGTAFAINNNGYFGNASGATNVSGSNIINGPLIANVSGSNVINGALIANISGTNLIAGSVKSPALAPEGLSILGTNSFPAGSDIAFGRFAVSSLANGANAAVPVGTNIFVEVSGPSGAFSIAGIAGGRDGKYLMLLNLTGQNMTLSHESGSDPTPANRITSLTGADEATIGNGAVTLIYNGNTSRWILLSLKQ